ncbi:MAG: XapX domain-containing protein [Candidatus Marinimicrobia bacterium]|nr:XapX domain-containing protein [Candidatus Neomarinimicrobiota bacterium]MBL7023775.1 XapX domain-containing protein [Candidatus Neomarinimicrobiota bacterium]MBL7110100.1 XapX domain-containing protein [Candidatus Neomarinimicrobiota bacterium]
MLDFIVSAEFLKGVKVIILGLVLGGIFAFFKFEPPVPSNIYGLLGIIGIFLGWFIIKTLIS